ncbi:MAG: glycosyltransferase family 4 protein [Nitrospirae bacterium]|nr:glycosyltransferase family 4 protein [Nitrospirota bacterium]
MNVLFVSHQLYPSVTGGAEIFNYYLLKELARFHNIAVLTGCEDKSDLPVTCIRIDAGKFGPARISIPLEDIANIIKMRHRTDFIHVASYSRAHWLQWLTYPLTKKLLGIPYLITIHGGGMHPWKPAFPHKVFFENAAAIVGVSQAIKDEYESRSGRKIVYIPPLIPFEGCREDRQSLRMKYGFGSTETILLCLGSIKKIKGNDVLLDSFIQMDRGFIEKNRLRLLFVGDGIMRKELEMRAAESKFGKFVTFAGRVPHEEIPALFKIADIYIIPSLFEGTPISMIEAMFNGMPIIGSNTRGINTIIEHGRNGLLFEVGDRDDLRDKIEYLVQNKGIAETLADGAGQTYQRNYNFDSVVRQYLKIYSDMKDA